MKLEFYRQNFEKFSNINFHENPSSGSRIVPYERTDGLTKPIVPFHILANVSNKIPSFKYSSTLSLGRHVVRPLYGAATS
jgi:hypothetical protein